MEMRCQPSIEITTAAGDITAASDTGSFYGALVLTDGTNAADVKVYNGTVAGGKLLAHLKCAGTSLMSSILLPYPAKFLSSCHVLVTGIGASAIVYLGG